MEIENLGTHCSCPDCKQLDFLPFRCAGCMQIFCLDHRTPSAHKCPSPPIFDVKTVECPLCATHIPIRQGDDINIKLDDHITHECKGEKEPKKRNKCSVPRCPNTFFYPIICKYCGQNFCVRHRVAIDHRCPKLEEAKAAKMRAKAARSATATTSSSSSTSNAASSFSISSILDKYRKSTTSTSKAATTANLMRVKQKAKGDEKIAMDKRIYLEVIFPMDSKVLPKMMFFNQAHSIGKVLDIVADAGNIPNENNKPGTEKLYLIAINSGRPLRNDKPIKDAVENGDAILLERLPTIDPTSDIFK